MADNTKRIEFKPDYAVAPGATLLETIQSRGLSQAELAKRTGRPLKTINEIIKGKAAITAETALQLEHVLGVPASFWNNLERNYQQALAALKEQKSFEGAQVGIPVKVNDDSSGKPNGVPVKANSRRSEATLAF